MMMITLKEGSRPPGVGLGAAIWVQIAAGNGYAFPLYSHPLKSLLCFNQRQVTLLGFANDFGENVGLLPGIASNKFPPWLILFIGAFASFFGYGVLWLSVTKTVDSLPYWLLWIALSIATNSNALLGTVVLVTNMRNFPASRGAVAGILKGYSGISGAVFTKIYSIVLKNSSSHFLLFLAIGIPDLCFSIMFLIRPCTPASADDSAEHGHFAFFQFSSVILGLYLIATTAFSNVLPLSGKSSYVLFVVMILLIMDPLVIPVKMTLLPRKCSKPETSNLQVGSSSECLVQQGKDEKTEPLLPSSSSSATLGNFYYADESSEVAMLLAEGEGAVKMKRRPKRGEDFTFMETVIMADLWLLFLVFFVGIGSGVTVLNNLTQIGIAQVVKDATILLSIFSFCNFIGRLSGGVASEHFVRTKMIPRTFWMTCTQIIMTILYLIFAFVVKGTLFFAVALLSVCYGVQFSKMISMVSELFGLKHFGVLYNFMSLGNPVGAFLFSALLAGQVYDKEAATQQHGLVGLLDSGASCLGPNCFRLTFFVLAAVSAFGFILSIILSFRIKPVYQMLYSGGSFRLPHTSIH